MEKAKKPGMKGKQGKAKTQDRRKAGRRQGRMI